MSANFTPSQSAIKDLKPFRFWCQKVLPTVYDDSLSYYELLTKVVNYLNDTIDNVEALNDNVQNIYDAYILLQDYVNEYFDQNFPQLVSDKLDEMAEDGTLTALISGYIDPLFEAKTDEIDEIIEQQNSTISEAIAEQNNTISEAIEEQDSDISLLQTRMNNFINNHAGLVGEETIWEGSTPFVTENTSITLDNPVSDYLFIDIYYNHRGKRAVQRFQKSDVLDAGGFYVRDAETQRAPGSTPQLYPYFRILQFKLVHSTNNGSVLTLAESNESVWDGDITSYPTTEISPSTSGITKIVGVNMVQSDSEVADARVTEDGTVYPNLEARLNAEFTDIKNSIGGGGLTADIKQALMRCFNYVAWKNNDPNASVYIAELNNALYPPVDLSYITAVYTQSGTVYDTDSLEVLRSDLVVTAHYSGGTTGVVTAYALSGVLAVGTSTITVTYAGKTTTFSVTVSAGVPSAYTEYDYVKYTKSQSSNVGRTAIIPTKTYDNLNAISLEFEYVSRVGTSTGMCILGGRTASGATSSLAFYTKTDTMGYHIHGDDTAQTISQTQNVKHTVKLTNGSATPSTLTFDETDYSITWVNNNTINTFLSLFTNQQTGVNTIYCVPNIELGIITVKNLNGETINVYKPCVRNSDNVIGLYDIVEQEFYTCSTVSNATIGDSNNKYDVGNWS